MARNRNARKNRKTSFVIPLCVIAVFVVAIAALFAVVLSDKEEPETLEPAMAEVQEFEEPVESEEPQEEVRYIDPDIDPSYYRVINRSYPIPENYVAGTGELREIEGKKMETNACIALEQMVAALRAEGMDIIVQSGYRTDGDQEYLFDRQIGRQSGDEIKAATISAVPLTSEHQAGLAVDLSVDGSLTDAFGHTPQGQWLAAHCAEYGYILRYPAEKTIITGIIPEPWHFRFVGSANQAKAIMESGLCMEEYFEQYLAPEDIDPYLPYLQ
ncbi:MAG: M15 family metallopeptidase [Firmicutes bacterium]|nr:M15 family metallopeptidase [Bacillota bacterium]